MQGELSWFEYQILTGLLTALGCCIYAIYRYVKTYLP